MTEKKSKYVLQGAAFDRVEALSLAFKEAEKQARKMQEDAHDRLFAQVKVECPDLEFENGNVVIDRENSDMGIIVVKDLDALEECGCSACDYDKSSSLLDVLKAAMKSAAKANPPDAPTFEVVGLKKTH